MGCKQMGLVTFWWSSSFVVMEQYTLHILRVDTSGKKSASRRTGCVQTHQVLGTLWAHPVSAHTAPNTKHTGNVNSDIARHGTVRPDADRHGICLLDGAWQGIFLLDALCQGIFLLDAAVSVYFPTGHVWTTRLMPARIRKKKLRPECPDAACHGICLPDGVCQGIFLLDAAVSEHFPSGRSCIRANGVWTTRVMALRSRWLSRHGTSQQILSSHSQTRRGFQA